VRDAGDEVVAERGDDLLAGVLAVAGGARRPGAVA